MSNEIYSIKSQSKSLKQEVKRQVIAGSLLKEIINTNHIRIDEEQAKSLVRNIASSYKELLINNKIL